jgi:hypothetical protein
MAMVVYGCDVGWAGSGRMDHKGLYHGFWVHHDAPQAGIRGIRAIADVFCWPWGIGHAYESQRGGPDAAGSTHHLFELLPNRRGHPAALA